MLSRHTRALAIVLPALLCNFAQALDAQTDPRIKAVESTLSPAVVPGGHPPTPRTIVERMKTYHVPGISVAVIHEYRLEWAKGYGVMDRGTNEAVGTETLFQAGSISKPVAAIAAMKLVEDGKLALDEDVNLKLRSWKVPESEFTRTQKVTLRRILSHSAGLTVHGFPGYPAGGPVPGLLDILDGHSPANTPPIRVDAAPGSIWRYSGGGFTIMQLLLTDVTGKSFPELMDRLVLSSVGMSHSTYEQPLPERSRRFAATGHNAAGLPIAGKYHTYPEMAAAGLWTTPSDLARFGIEIQKSREGRSNIVLKKQAVAEMLNPQKGAWGLGFELKLDPPAPRFLHGGADEGFRAQCIFGFDGEGAVVMTNSDNGSALAFEIIQSIASVYGWRNMAPRERESITLEPAILETFAGRYQSPQLGAASMRVEGDHLVVSSAVFSDLEFYPASTTKFFPLTGNFPDLAFSKNERGEVIGVSAGEMRATKVAGAK
jgi:CubicO group peptidase (beta-lactamase class C family)